MNNSDLALREVFFKAKNKKLLELCPDEDQWATQDQLLEAEVFGLKAVISYWVDIEKENNYCDNLRSFDFLQEGDLYHFGPMSSPPVPIKKEWIGKQIFELIKNGEIDKPYDFYRLNPHFRDKSVS